jgi:hypothetical protein
MKLLLVKSFCVVGVALLLTSCVTTSLSTGIDKNRSSEKVVEARDQKEFNRAYIERLMLKRDY